MLTTFTNSLDPEQAQQNVWPDTDPNLVTLKGLFENVYFEKIISANHLACKELLYVYVQRLKSYALVLSDSLETGKARK